MGGCSVGKRAVAVRKYLVCMVEKVGCHGRDIHTCENVKIRLEFLENSEFIYIISYCMAVYLLDENKSILKLHSIHHHNGREVNFVMKVTSVHSSCLTDR